jgi:hypothetical protein
LLSFFTYLFDFLACFCYLCFAWLNNLLGCILCYLYTFIHFI